MIVEIGVTKKKRNQYHKQNKITQFWPDFCFNLNFEAFSSQEFAISRPQKRQFSGRGCIASKLGGCGNHSAGAYTSSQARPYRLLVLLLDFGAKHVCYHMFLFENRIF